MHNGRSCLLIYPHISSPKLFKVLWLNLALEGNTRLKFGLLHLQSGEVQWKIQSQMEGLFFVDVNHSDHLSPSSDNAHLLSWYGTLF